MIFVNVSIPDEIREPARRVPGQAPHQVQQCRALGSVEHRAKPDIVGPDVQAQRDFLLLLADQELVQQVAGRKRHFIKLRPVPSVKENATAARVLDDGVQALPELVHGLVQQHAGGLAIRPIENANLLEATAQSIRNLRLALGLNRVDELVRGPLAPLDAIHRSQVILAQAIGVGQPLSILIGVLVPHLAPQRAEISSAARCTQEADQFPHDGFERQLLRRDGWKTCLQVEAEHRARNAEGANTRAVVLPTPLLKNLTNQVQILLHRAPNSGEFSWGQGQPSPQPTNARSGSLTRHLDLRCQRRPHTRRPMSRRFVR